MVAIGPAASADPNYDGIDPADVTFTNTDDDDAGHHGAPTGTSTAESGTSATFTVVLTSQPTADVTIPVISSDTTEGTVSPASLTFTAANWSTPQTVTVTGVDDAVEDGTQPYTVQVGPATGGDAVYTALLAQSLAFTNTDDDVAGITVGRRAGPPRPRRAGRSRSRSC